FVGPGILCLRLAARSETAVLRVLVVFVGNAATLRREEAREVPARGGDRQHLLPTLRMRIRDEGTDEIGFEGLDERLSDVGFFHESKSFPCSFVVFLLPRFFLAAPLTDGLSAAAWWVPVTTLAAAPPRRCSSRARSALST